jgi:flagellar hook protein FlgE
MGFTSFSIALSALSAQTTAIDVVSNNLANLNTTGYKESTASFHDLVTQSLGAGLGGSTQVGFGVGTPVTVRQFTQGAIQSTSGPLDVAIQGDGFLLVNTPQGAAQYSRGGNLVVDTSGNLTDATGDFIQGWGATGGVVDTNLPVGKITLPVGALKAPVATANVSVDLNLNAAATAGPPPDSFSTSMQVYDSLGDTHVVTFNFTKTTTANAWTYTMSFPPGDTTAPSTPVTGTVQFDGNGNLASPLPTDPAIVLNVPGLSDGASDMNITWNLYNGTTPRITQFTQPSATSALSQDGAAAANLVKVGISDGGSIVAQYSSGTQVTVGQLAMATIRNPESLLAVGNNNYALTALSALPAVGLPGTGGRGQILGGSVEASNVDIATEFTNLIVFQRGYEANARVITTVDQLSQDTIALKPA